MRIKQPWLIIVLMLLIASSALLIAGCGPKAPPAQCSTNAECKSALSCTESFCSQGQCKTVPKADCCGNGKCEAGESSCTCMKDCGACQGRLQVPDARGKMGNASYIIKACEAQQCVYTFNATTQRPKDLFNEFTGVGFKMNIVATYPQPFDARSSVFQFDFKVKDVSDIVVKLPVTINEIRIMEGTHLIGQQSAPLSFANLGDELQQAVPVTYALSLPEETKSLTVALDYEYTPLLKVREKGIDGQYHDTYQAQDPVRKTYTFPITDRIVLIDPSVTN